MNLNWKASTDDLAQIEGIVKRLHEIAVGHGIALGGTPLDYHMDIAACHLNRETGKLEGCFMPRYALRETV